jgi:hypothetical protein
MGVGRIFVITGTSAWWSGKRIPGGELAGEWEGKVKIRPLEELRVRHPGEDGKERKSRSLEGARDDIRVARIGLGGRRNRLAFLGSPIAGDR